MKLATGLIIFLLLVIGSVACNLQLAATPTALNELSEPPIDSEPEVIDSFTQIETQLLPEEKLQVLQVLARYQPGNAQGSLELTICNRGAAPSAPFTARILINETTFDLFHGDPILAGSCAPVYDGGRDFSTYGIMEIGEISVSVLLLDDQGVFLEDGQNFNESLNLSYLEVPATIPYVTVDEFELRSDPLEVLKVHNQYSVMIPADYEELANYVLYDNLVCAALLAEYFEVPIPTESIYMGYYLEGSGGESGGYWGKGLGIGVKSYPEFLASLVDRLPYFWEGALRGECGNGHEMVHLFLNDGPIPGWLNEGLATYMEAPERGGRSDRGSVICKENGFLDSSGVEYAHLDLSSPAFDPSLDRILYYYSANCFWDYLDVTYGHEAFTAVVRAVIENSDVKILACRPFDGIDFAFMRDIVVPVIGEDILAVTEKNWNVGLNFTGCER